MRALAALFLLTTPTLAAGMPGYGAIDAARDTTPLTLATTFCLDSRTGDMSNLAAHLAPKLKKLIAQHDARHLESRIPWLGRDESPLTCVASVLNHAPDTIGVLVRLDYVGPRHHWSDTLNFERTETSWLLNNVFYAGGGNLRFKLLDQIVAKPM